MDKRITSILKLLFGLLILAVLLFQVKITEVYDVLLTIQPVYLIIIILLSFLAILIGSYNIFILSLPIDKLPKYQLFKYSFLSWSIGLFMPGKLGEFSLIYFLKKHNIGYGQGLVIGVLDKLITFILYALFAVAGIAIFFMHIQALRVLLITILIALGIVALFLVSKRTFLSSITNFIKKYILRKFSDKFKGFSKSLVDYLKNQKKIILANSVVTLSKLIVSSLIPFFLFMAFGFKINFAYVLLIFCIMRMVALIPISINGLGTKEATAVYLYSLINIPTEVTLTVHLIFLVLNYSLAALSMLFFHKEIGST